MARGSGEGWLSRTSGAQSPPRTHTHVPAAPTRRGGVLQRLQLAAPERPGEEGCAHGRQGCELAEENPKAVGLAALAISKGRRRAKATPPGESRAA